MPQNQLHHCPAPAKINLFLHIIGQRADGYHLLQTVLQLLDRGDMLDFVVRDDGIIQRSNDIAGIPLASDLVIRAAKLLQSATGQTKLGADIHVKKMLPIGGGLGGGSSDAATTLIVLNSLWQTALTRSQLMALGLQLGADVPFFLCGGNAFAEGIGEVLTRIATPPRWVVVIEPAVHIPTASIYAAPELTKDTKPITMTNFLGTDHFFNGSFGRNDLEMVAAKRFPAVAAALKWLSAFGNARMSGSGACVFCPFEYEPDADAVLKQTPAPWKAWKTRTLQEHPLAHLLEPV